jgi:hypothetical protein
MTLDSRSIAEIIREPPQRWDCSHRRREEDMTDPFGLSLGGLVVREYQVNTAVARWLDALVLHADHAGRPFATGVVCGKCISMAHGPALDHYVRGSSATLVQTKLATLGSVLLGQTLFGGLALKRRPWAPAVFDLVALCTAREPELEALLPQIPGCERMRVAIGSLDGERRFLPNEERPKRPTRQIPLDHELADRAYRVLKLSASLPPPVLSSGEAPEAVFETPEGLVVIHTVPRPASLALAGLVLFLGEAVAARGLGPIRSVAVTTKPDPVVTSLVRAYPRCEVLRADGRRW